MAQPGSARRGSSRWPVVVAVYAVAAGLGYLVATRGLPPFGPAPQTGSTPAARVGWALRETQPQAPPESWAALRVDVAAVRQSWPAAIRPVLDLVVAVRGWNNGGDVDAQRCP